MVTISCLTYNHEPYIRQCLDGFVMQKTNFRFEAIVHDDASTDGTAAIIKEYAERYPDIIKPIFEIENQYSKRDGSLTRIMNSHMHGKYIAMCEGDDYWIDPLKLQKQVDFLEAHPNYGFSYTNVIIDQSDKNIIIKRKTISISDNICDYLMTKNNPIITATVCMRKDIYMAFNLEKDKYEINMLMGDLPLWIYASKDKCVHFLDERTTAYRLLLESASHSKDPLKLRIFMENAKDIKLYMNSYYNLGYSEAAIWKNHYTNLLLQMSQYSKEMLFDIIKDCIKQSPSSFLNWKVIYYILKGILYKKMD